MKQRLHQQSEGDGDEEYHLMAYGFIRFRNKMYVLDNSELKNIILRRFHVKPYLGHPGYQETLMEIKKFYHGMNLEKEVV